MGLINRLYSKLTGPKTKFRPGDYVQPYKGGPLMIVQDIEKNPQSHTVMLNCKWFDSETKSTQTNRFTENQVLPFDWYNP
jgi:uncharacterized protein YodC (DUF2158 family)